MSSPRDYSGIIEQILRDISAAHSDRINRILASETGSIGPITITNIEGDAISCAIGPGATLTARDLLVMLESQAGSDPVIEEVITRLRRLPSLDTDLPEKHYGPSAAEAAGQRAAAMFDRVLAARKLIDPDSADFGRTKHSTRMYSVNALKQHVPIKVVGIFFALTSPPLVRNCHQGRFFDWMNCNQRIYAPINGPYFLPSSKPVYMSKSQVWHSSGALRVPNDQTYFTYLAADIEEGCLEYGFSAGNLLKPEGGPVIYAKVIGGFVAFLRFLRDLCVTFDSDPTAMSVGLAIRGTVGSTLDWISNHGGSTRPADADGFLWRRSATPGTDWTVDNVARQAAVEILEHWSYVGQGADDVPEFAGGKYMGALARTIMPGNWG